MNPTVRVKQPQTKAPARTKRPAAGRKKIALALIALLAVFCLMTLWPALGVAWLGMPQPQLPVWGKGIAIYDRDNNKVCTIYGACDQEPVSLREISPSMQHAIISAEDHDFYSHDGVNMVSIARAVLVDLSTRHPLQGGSTISQQLVKNLYFEGKKRTILDKVPEALMALALERRYKKAEILEAYLNCVYFGNGAYGVERASEDYFGKHAAFLDSAESAFLSGLVTAPSQLSLPENRSRAIARQHLVLASMKDLGYITQAQYNQALNEHLAFQKQTQAARNYKFYTSEVIELVRRQFGDAKLYTLGYRVYTYLDPIAQLIAQRALQAGIKRAPPGINQGALVSISVADGGITAIVGGAGSFDNNQWNRALSPHTAGSAFKPFVYLTGLIDGALQSDTMLDDSPIEISQPGQPVYRPRDYDGKYLGPITIRKALALSRNIPAVKVALSVGPQAVVKTAQQAGIKSPLDPEISLALGSSAVTPLEMANSYATLARGGIYRDASLVRRIEDANGNVIKQFDSQPIQVFDQEPTAELVDALQDVVERGTGTGARLFDRPVAGKTGTADGSKDIWFIGMTPDMVTAVWGGNDDNKKVPGHATGGSVMASIFQDYMRSYYRQRHIPPSAFLQPQHPLLLEPEPLHVMPYPADIFHRLFDPLFGPPPAPQRAPAVSQDSPYDVQPPADGLKPSPRRNRGIFRRLGDALGF